LDEIDKHGVQNYRLLTYWQRTLAYQRVSALSSACGKCTWPNVESSVQYVDPYVK